MSDTKSAPENAMSTIPASRIPKPEEVAAAKLLREAGWVVTAPSDVSYGCFCELATCKAGTRPDGCVIQQGQPEDCIYAKGRTTPDGCEYWRPWTEESIKEYWQKVENGEMVVD